MLNLKHPLTRRRGFPVDLTYTEISGSEKTLLWKYLQCKRTYYELFASLQSFCRYCLWADFIYLFHLYFTPFSEVFYWYTTSAKHNGGRKPGGIRGETHDHPLQGTARRTTEEGVDVKALGLSSHRQYSISNKTFGQISFSKTNISSRSHFIEAATFWDSSWLCDQSIASYVSFHNSLAFKLCCIVTGQCTYLSFPEVIIVCSVWCLSQASRYSLNTGPRKVHAFVVFNGNSSCAFL